MDAKESDINFLSTYQNRAIALDRTDGTHAIEQPSIVDHTTLLYDNIIYNKATVMMRSLEQASTGVSTSSRDSLISI